MNVLKNVFFSVVSAALTACGSPSDSGAAVTPSKAPVEMTLASPVLPDRPPACSDKETLSLMQRLFESALTDAFVDFGVAEPSSFVKTVINNTKLTLRDIRTLGYDENAKRYSCEATIELIFNQPNPRLPTVVSTIHNIVTEVENYQPSSNSFFEAIQSAGIKKSLNYLAIKTVDEFDSAILDANKISNSVTYYSTYAESEDKEKNQYLESTGIRPVASYAKAVFNSYGFSDKPKEKAQQKKDTVATVEKPHDNKVNECVSSRLNALSNTDQTDESIISNIKIECGATPNNVTQ